MALSSRRCALLLGILGAHLALLYLISASDARLGSNKSAEVSGTLFWLDIPDPEDTWRAAVPPSVRSTPIRTPSLEDDSVPHLAIAPLPDIHDSDALIDWDAEASRIASEAARRQNEQRAFRALDQHPAGIGAAPPQRSGHQQGDSEHFEGGVIIDWTGSRCHYSNQDAHVDAFGPALKLQLPTCKGG